MQQMWHLCLSALLLSLRACADVTFHCSVVGREVAHGRQKLDAALRSANLLIREVNHTDVQLLVRYGDFQVSTPDADEAAALKSESFTLRTHEGRVIIEAGGSKGAMYGMLSVAAQVREASNTEWASIAQALKEETAMPRFGYRALKYNTPISAYRPGDGTSQNYDDFVDLAFWDEFLDMLAENRFNAITIWALHPWPFMVRPKNFPEAASFSDTEFWGGSGTESEEFWRGFWTGLFKRAKDRGVDPYIVDWNVFLSEGYKKAYDHSAITDHNGSGGNGTVDASSKRYNKEIITEVINAYPDLAGIGITLGERMQNLGEGTGDLGPQIRYVEDVILAAVEQADRKINLIYRAALDNHAPTVVRASIDAFVKRTGIRVLVQLKFNWSHGHSTTKLIHAHSENQNTTGEGYWSPKPTSYKMAWMVRNEDFHFLRWGHAGFIRQHIAENGHDYVGGYITGSEEHIPATDVAELSPPAQRGWRYDFERQWLYYMLWGRLLYDPQTPDDIFIGSVVTKFGINQSDAQLLWEGYQSASIFPLRFASFIYNTWDFNLHSEDLTGEEGKFFSVTDLLSAKVLDWSSLQSIGDFLQNDSGITRVPSATKSCLRPSFCTPPELADELAAAASRALSFMTQLRDLLPTRSAAFEAELIDIETWAHLSNYFSLKVRGALALGRYLKQHVGALQQEAVHHLDRAAKEWDIVCELTSSHMKKSLPISCGRYVNWCGQSHNVRRDIDIARNASAHILI